MADLTTEIDGATLKLSIDCPEYLSGDVLSPAGRDYITVIFRQRDAAKIFAAREHLQIHNESWRDEEAEELTEEQFCAKMTLSGITILDEPGHATMAFEDGDMFWGHWIMISFEGDQPYHASLFG